LIRPPAIPSANEHTLSIPIPNAMVAQITDFSPFCHARCTARRACQGVFT
jgi:hypothetical protein